MHPGFPLRSCSFSFFCTLSFSTSPRKGNRRLFPSESVAWNYYCPFADLASPYAKVFSFLVCGRRSCRLIRGFFAGVLGLRHSVVCFFSCRSCCKPPPALCDSRHARLSVLLPLRPLFSLRFPFFDSPRGVGLFLLGLSPLLKL